MKKITIIGAGLGGLTAGALLSKHGYKVTLLEQHNIVGGCATTFKRKGGYTCEVGLHEMDAPFDASKKAIFESLGVYDAIEFVQPHEFFRIKSKEIDFVMPHGRQEAITHLCTHFPSERSAIEKYFSLIETIANEIETLGSASWWQYALFPLLFGRLLKYRTASTSTVMDRLFKDEKLKLILNANVGYYSDTVGNLSFLFHAIAQHSYYSGGGWYIKGGSQKLSDHLASVITTHGGSIVTKASVTKIDRQSVSYLHKKQTVTLSSDIIISNLAPEATYCLAQIPYQEQKKPASSILTIYIGFKHNLKSIYGEKPYTSFFFGDIDNISQYDHRVQGDILERGFGFTDYSQIDSGLTKDPEKSFAALITTDFLDEWKHLSPEDYQQQKEKVLEIFLEKLESEYPNIKEHIEFTEIGTAKTVHRYIKTPNGTAYGFAPTPKQFFRIPKVRSKQIRNLYFVGAWVIGGGFTPAIMSGAMCAQATRRDYPI